MLKNWVFHLSFMPSLQSVTKLSFHFSLRTKKIWDNKIVLNQFLAFDLLKWMSKTELRVKLHRDMEYCPLNCWKIGAGRGLGYFSSPCIVIDQIFSSRKILPTLCSWRLELYNLPSLCPSLAPCFSFTSALCQLPNADLHQFSILCLLALPLLFFAVPPPQLWNSNFWSSIGGILVYSHIVMFPMLVS